MNLTFRDELPSTLLLPASLRESNSRQNLSAVALLGKDFWKYPMSENSTSEKKEKTGASGLFLKEAFLLKTSKDFKWFFFFKSYTNVCGVVASLLDLQPVVELCHFLTFPACF